ncbi:protein DpdG [Nocardioides sp. CPCC 206347]|uniref:protein DpdG n=1 Tax=unclassified Nocardioides TaxID=2615069 RepID=UPI0036240DC8
MAVLNPPRSLPGLGRSLINFLIDARGDWTEDKLLDLFKPEGLNDGPSARDGLTNTLSSFRAIGMLRSENGVVTVSESVTTVGSKFSNSQFRRLMQTHVFDLERDGDPWHREEGDAHTSGARDLTRALSWLLAQDALGRPLSWTEKVQPLQTSQFQTGANEKWAITNDTRWTAASRWALALGLASPPMMIMKSAGVVPLPVVAVNDVLDDLPLGRIPITDFLTKLSSKIPVLHGGSVRTALTAHLGADPDPAVAEDCADSSIGQALRILEERGRLAFETLPDARGVRLARSDTSRQTHVTLKRGGKK